MEKAVDFTDSDEEEDMTVKFSHKIRDLSSKTANISMNQEHKASAMIQNESVLPETTDTNNSFVRTISIARPSLRNDVLSEDDFMKGILEKQSPSLLKRWQKRYFVLSNRVLK